MGYAAPNNWYEDDYYEERECSTCNDLESKIEDIKDFMQGVVDQIYGLEDFDELSLENYIEELCSQLKIKLPTTTIKLQKKD